MDLEKVVRVDEDVPSRLEVQAIVICIDHTCEKMLVVWLLVEIQLGIK